MITVVGLVPFQLTHTREIGIPIRAYNFAYLLRSILCPDANHEVKEANYNTLPSLHTPLCPQRSQSRYLLLAPRTLQKTNPGSVIFTDW